MEIPNLITFAKKTIGKTQRQLQALGKPRPTRLEQQLYLCRIGQQFSSLLKASAGGIYNEAAFFVDPMSPEGFARRLGARTENVLVQVAEELRRRGHTEEIVDAVSPNALPGKSRQVLRAEALRNVREVMRRSKGAELPGTVSTQIVGELFKRQAAP